MNRIATNICRIRITRMTSKYTCQTMLFKIFQELVLPDFEINRLSAFGTKWIILLLLG